jgi:hypothetical protein
MSKKVSLNKRILLRTVLISKVTSIQKFMRAISDTNSWLTQVTLETVIVLRIHLKYVDSVDDTMTILSSLCFN